MDYLSVERAADVADLIRGLGLGQPAVGGHSMGGQTAFRLAADYPELVHWAPLVLDKLKTVPEITDVSTDRQPGGLQADVVIDRTAAARLRQAN